MYELLFEKICLPSWDTFGKQSEKVEREQFTRNHENTFHKVETELKEFQI